MASSNDRKISQLPFQPVLADDTNFLIVNGITTTPRNERINTGVLFNEIPVPVSVGTPVNGRDVTFNSTSSPTNRFYFEAATGDLSLGHNLEVENDVTISGGLTVTGTATFTNPVLVNLTLPGDLTVNGISHFKSTLTTDTVANLESLNVTNNTTLNGPLTVNDDSIFNSNTQHTNIITNYLESQTSLLTDAQVTNLDVLNLNVANDLNIDGNIIANGFFRAIGNIFGYVGSFQEISVTANTSIGDTLTADNVVVNQSLTAPNFSTNSFTSQNILASVNINAVTFDSPLANVTTLNNTLFNGIDAFISNTVHATNLESTNLTSVVGDFTTINSTDINATDVVTSNSVQTVSVISDALNSDTLRLKVYTGAKPSYALFPVGTMIVYDNGTYPTLQIVTSSGWLAASFT